MSEMGETASDYAGQAAAFIAEAERIAALGLPVLPEDPAAAAAMRAAGYEVLAECTGLAGPRACILVSGVDDEEPGHSVWAEELAGALGVPVESLRGREFVATLRETPETGPVLSGFRRVPGSELAR